MDLARVQVYMANTARRIYINNVKDETVTGELINLIQTWCPNHISGRSTKFTKVRQTPGRHIQCTIVALMSLVKKNSGEFSISHSAAPEVPSQAARLHIARDIAVLAITVWNQTWPAKVGSASWL